MNKTTRVLLSLTAPVALLCVWNTWGDPSSPVVPPPRTWLASAATMFAAVELQLAILATLKTVLLSTLLACVTGTMLGIALGARPAISDAVAPTLEFLRSIPPPTIVPVAMLLMGSGAALEAVVVSFAALWPILLNVVHALRGVHPTLINTGRTLKISARSMWMNVYLPSVLPGVLTGLRVATPLAIIVTLLVEMLATRPGVGRLLLSAQRDFDAPAVFALLLTVGLTGVGVNGALVLLERLFPRAAPSTGR